MSLIRGLTGKYPCPVCLVPSEELSKSGLWPLRVAEESKNIVHQSTLENAEGRDNLLMSQSLRGVENVFWKVGHTDAHRALSYDDLHGGGLFSKHLWGQFKKHLEDSGDTRKLAEALDKQYA